VLTFLECRLDQRIRSRHVAAYARGLGRLGDQTPHGVGKHQRQSTLSLPDPRLEIGKSRQRSDGQHAALADFPVNGPGCAVFEPRDDRCVGERSQAPDATERRKPQ